MLFTQVLEKLYRLKWGPLDGLGALVISPTRELALQIFDELRKIGKKHEFSAGLLIGGKKVKEEQERVHGKLIWLYAPLILWTPYLRQFTVFILRCCLPRLAIQAICPNGI